MSRQSFSSGEYQNTNEVRKFIARIQIDTEEYQGGTSTGWGYIDSRTLLDDYVDTEFFIEATRRNERKEKEEDYL